MTNWIIAFYIAIYIATYISPWFNAAMVVFFLIGGIVCIVKERVPYSPNGKNGLPPLGESDNTIS